MTGKLAFAGDETADAPAGFSDFIDRALSRAKTTLVSLAQRWGRGSLPEQTLRQWRNNPDRSARVNDLVRFAPRMTEDECLDLARLIFGKSAIADRFAAPASDAATLTEMKLTLERATDLARTLVVPAGSGVTRD